MDAPEATFTRAASPIEGAAETDFEKRRGISHLDIRTGLAQVHIGGMGADPTHERIALLKRVAEAGVSIDFLKLTPTGLSFVIAEDHVPALRTALERGGALHSVDEDRAILLVHAVNMRDEEGMIAAILAKAIGSGFTIDHASDMHDRMLLVLQRDEARRLAAMLAEGSELV
ncbi:hypothetical protein EON81_27050 [bacterium]|nr:MAG: hypothetical protein EON81_27050 [bacterium]